MISTAFFCATRQSFNILVPNQLTLVQLLDEPVARPARRVRLDPENATPTAL